MNVARQFPAWLGTACRGGVWPGESWFGKAPLILSWRVRARPGEARHGGSWPGSAPLSTSWLGGARLVPAWPGATVRGLAPLFPARLGVSRHGRVGVAGRGKSALDPAGLPWAWLPLSGHGVAVRWHGLARRCCARLAKAPLLPERAP